MNDQTSGADTEDVQLGKARSREALLIARYAGGVAHDLNNQLVAITGRLQLIEDELPPSHIARQDVTALMQVADQVAHMAKRMLALRPERGQAAREVDVSPLFKAEIGWLERLLDRGLKWRAEITVGGPLKSQVDPTGIARLMLGLVLTGSAAVPEGGQLTLLLGAEGDRAQITLATTDTNERPVALSCDPAALAHLLGDRDGATLISQPQPHVIQVDLPTP